ncbi:MAG: hypothetical protein CMP65_01585 [Flavobacteriales bacterium]|nr:hypothetical protein [Flavobacteriales bacterium]|tara:strand:+ start:77 stop:652 length:576 start_codon:yes stop_codon:yes gene_type:complete
MYFINPTIYAEIVKEDGSIEYISAIALLIASCILFKSFVKRRQQLKLSQKTGLIIMGLILFFGFAEEISWGQRIFNISSPDFFLDNNLQSETNIHNLNINGIKLNKWIFTYLLVAVLSVYFLFTPVIHKKYNSINNIFLKYSIPIPKLEYSVVFLIMSIVLNILQIPRVAELWECVFAITMVMVCLNPNDE